MLLNVKENDLNVTECGNQMNSCYSNNRICNVQIDYTWIQMYVINI